MTKILVTGASGMLGRSVFEQLCSAFENVEGWAFTRLNSGQLKKVDITEYNALETSIDMFKPDIVVHCAAERRPDKVAENPELAEKINLTATKRLSQLTARRPSSMFVYISTDYVFDGRNPPYSEESEPNPINQYGRLKYEGEKAVLQSVVSNSSYAVVLRVPILYGPVEYLGEGAVDGTLKNLLDTNRPLLIDNYQKRYPTHVADVANVVTFIVKAHVQTPGSMSGIYHWSATEMLTKYDKVKTMSEVFSLSIGHLKPQSEPPKEHTASDAQRPINACLTCHRLLQLGLVQNSVWNFKDAIRFAYEKFVPS